ncbi:hypothetical protein GIB67_018526 [Kingdonia uniflora]|uniref:Aminotransferase-like plant mobile domain-containing protein n=1 Tax=Kingdonia uniflora TaxID=39325 RepID=A0A7J7LW52_9MAGN|nr:hypothetical protein GIB67_018526 [Kingdonia uniflora]
MLEQEVAELRQALTDKQEQERAMLQVLMRIEQEQRVTEDARVFAEQDAAAQRYATNVLQEKYEDAMASLAQMEKRVVMAESMLEATLQYQSGQVKAQPSPRPAQLDSSPGKVNLDSTQELPVRKISLLSRPFGLGWRDKNKGKPTTTEEPNDGAGILLSLKKLKSHYAYKLEKVLSDGTAAAAKKKKGLTTRSVARAYMLYVLGTFLFPTKKGTDVSACYLVLFAKDKLAKKWSRGSAVLAHMYYNLGAASRDDARQFACCTRLLESWIFAYFPKLGRIPKEMDSDAYEHCTCWKWDVSITDRYGGSTLLNFREALDNYKLEDVVWDLYRDKRDSLHAFKEVNFFYGALANDSGIHQRKPVSANAHGDTPVHQSEDIAEQYDASTSECDMLKETIEQMKEEIELTRVVDEQCALEFADLPRQLDAKCKEIEKLKAANTILMEQIDMQLSPATPSVPDTTLAKKYEDLLAAYEDIKKKLIAKEDYRQKLVNTEERMKSLEANNSEWHRKLVNSEERKKTLEVDNNEWEIWRQALKKALPKQQGPKGDYQEDLVSTAVTLENVVIARREKMVKKNKMQELLFQPWTKYLVDIRGVEISDNNSGFRATAAIQHQNQHRFPDVMKSLKIFLYKDPAFWKSIFSQTLGIQFTADGGYACQILLQACSYGHQHVEYRHMAYLLATYYEKVVVFISHTEAYTFLPLFWARKRNTTSNEERFQNLVMDTSKYWWFGLGVDNHFVRLFPRFDAPMPPLSTIFYSHVNLEIPLGFMKE